MGKRPPGPGRGNKVKQGNGPGWGGPAKGAGSSKVARPHGKEGQAIQAATGTGMFRPPEVRAEQAARVAATREEMLEFYVEVKRNEDESTLNRMAATEKWFDRTEGRPAQTNINENTGPGGGPMIHRIERVIIDPKN